MSQQETNRRDFLKTSAAALAGAGAAGYWITGKPSHAFYYAEQNDRPLVGQIGCGGRGNAITNQATRFGDVVAVCDVDSKRADAAKAKQGKGKADVYGDYRKVLDRDDLDIIIVGTPDHWHVKVAIEALKAGKDVYCEKPLTLTIDEGKKICQVVKDTNKVFQVGTQQRSEYGQMFQKAVALCREGRLGKIKRITAAIGGAPTGGPFQKTDPPANLNWEMWLGQTPLVDYMTKRCHYEFRWWYEYSGGKMTDWGAHHVDIAHWALGADDTGPESIEGTASHPVPLKDGRPTKDNYYNTATQFNVRAKFADGAELAIVNSTPDFGNGILIEGDKGRIFVNRSKLTGKPVEELADKPLPEDALVKLYKGNQPTSHMANFFECVKSRKEPVSDVFSHHRAMTTCHLANICIRLGRKLQWDPKAEQIVGDEDANAWLSREQRKGYEIKV